MKHHKNHIERDNALVQPLNRRRALLTLGAAGAAGIALTPGIASAANKVKTTARIVIAGSGLGGLAAANRLARELDGAKITLIDARKAHLYQPGFTSRTSESISRGIEDALKNMKYK